MPIHALKARCVVFSDACVELVRRPVGIAQIFPAIIRFHPINVVNFTLGPVSSDNQPNKAVEKVSFVVMANKSVAITAPWRDLDWFAFSEQYPSGGVV